MRRNRKNRAPEAASPVLAAPTAVRAVDIDQPIGDIVVPASRSGAPYASLLVVPTSHGCPLGTLTFDLPDPSGVPGERLSSAISGLMAEQIGAHLGADDIVAPNGDESPVPAAAQCRVAPLRTGPPASVVVNTCADVDATLRCLAGVLAMPYEPFEVIVVDNRPAGSRVRAAVGERFGDDGRVRVVDEPHPGLATARNAGLREAAGEIIAVIDDDVVVDPFWLGRAARRFQDEPTVACVTGLILPAELETREQLLIEGLGAFGKGFSPRTFSLKRAPEGDPLFPYAGGTFGSGANTVLRAQAADLLGGYEESLGTGTPARGGEDLDLFIRLLLAGEEIAYEPSAFVWHRHPSGAGAPRRQAINYGIGLSAMLTHRWLAGGDRARMLRAAPAGFAYLRDADSRRNRARGADFPRSLRRWEALGLAAGPLAYLKSRASARRARGTFTPAWVGEVDLAEPPVDRPIPRCDGKRYGAARLLVRNAGEPLALLDLELTTGTLRAAQVQAAVKARLAVVPQPADRSRHGLTGDDGSSRSATDISVVVCTRDRPESLRATLTSVLQAEPSPFEVLVIDNAPSGDATRALVAELSDRRLRYVVEPVPGLSRARNRGVAEARCAIVAFTDDDVVVDRAWLSGLERGFARAPEVALVTGLVATAELETQAQQIFESSVSWSTNCAARVWDLSAPPPGDVLFPYTAGQLGTGANFALKREYVSALGPFDEALGAGTPTGGGEDLDIFLRALLCGFKLAYEPTALVWHRHRREAEALRGQTFSYGAGLSAYACKHLSAPQTRREVARRVPRALLRAGQLAGRGRLGGRSRRAMLRAQLLGYASGPLLYRRSRRAVRRRECVEAG
jgi:GT2 family glycosyltransferase